ncbi:hypothetical protein PHYBLDRAFT_166898 [Phycomyces blakesleeanus NRRL 1555(-)]|uniref:Uncharacterized protein n=1 Tax=Phycomyces blakesleeanus (strain ATCC 8743b / DSM 1359 / FGSC 10004 / NBRC 33097 / NRRL 1555) TaxID=763407 RepID=A0A163ATF2_PHYB8|nr:hypothetical protein PHYBLDRAFT_166898 [Phycomyces blakesleeanus NRRL 1555(-)]OAD75671.1 hypothetical protein PHYBLDRAFT_166898 [Phycomyces blakesleeanus NRRL 1555(-)]|eukprot:XP_018293711.1 hypothetical protein PHYBLDRAFT_166898 [Phycomyces blakesleeanus NRRL 1555(-)]
MSTFNIAASYNNRIISDYIEAVNSFDLSFEDEFTNWLNDIAKKHANKVYHQSYSHKKNMVFIGKPLENPLKVKTVVYLCDYAGKSQVKKTSQHAQKCVRTTKSIKIGCPASIYNTMGKKWGFCWGFSWRFSLGLSWQFSRIAVESLVPF